MVRLRLLSFPLHRIIGVPPVREKGLPSAAIYQSTKNAKEGANYTNSLTTKVPVLFEF